MNRLLFIGIIINLFVSACSSCTGPTAPIKPWRSRTYEASAPTDKPKPKPVPDLELVDYRCETAFDRLEVGYLSKPAGGDTQTKDGVAITVKPLQTFDREYLRVVKLAEVEEKIPGGRKTVKGERLESLFPGRASAPVFSVTVSNKTDHVISLAGMVVALSPEAGNPITAMTSGLAGNGGSVQGGRMTDAQEEQERLRGDQRSSDVIAALHRLDLPPLGEAVKVLPGYEFTGHVAFDASLLNVGKHAKLMFFELVTAVDRAGIPTKRANFTFDFEVSRGRLDGAVSGESTDGIAEFLKACRSEKQRWDTASNATIKDRDAILAENAKLTRSSAPAQGAKPVNTCSDRIDNDKDGWTDVQDPDCRSGFVESALTTASQCNDGKDNDGDGKRDSTDPNCSNGADLDERQ